MKFANIRHAIAITCLLFGCAWPATAQERVSTNDLRLVDMTQSATTRELHSAEVVLLDEHRAAVGDVETVASEGQVISRRIDKTDYTILGSGLHYLGPDGKFRASEVAPAERLSPDDPVVYDRLAAGITFSSDINEPSSAEFTRSGVSTKSGIAGIQYVNRETGKEFLVAWVKSSPVAETDQGVVYEDAFAGAVADVRYVISENKIQQDVILYALPDPALFEMSLETTDLRVLTEIMEVSPSTSTAVRDGELAKADASAAPIQLYRDGSQSERLFNLQRGYAYPEGEGWAVGGKGSENRHLLRMGIVEMGNRVFLAEEIPLEAIQSALPNLFVRDSEFLLPDRKQTASIPPTRPTVSESNLAGLDAYRSRPGFVIDYINWYSTVTNSMTLEAGETYLVTTDLAIDGTNATLIIEPGAVIKLTEGSSINILNGAGLQSYSHLHNPAVFTSADDLEFGQFIAGYGSEAPESNLYEAAFVLTGNSTLEGVRIRYAEIGVQIDLGATVKHSIIELGDDGIVANTVSTNWNVTVRNVLFKDLNRGLTVDAVTNSLSGVYLNTCTMDNISEYGVSRDGTITWYYLNCTLFASVTNEVIYSNQTVSAINCGVYNSPTQGLGNVKVVTNNPFKTGTYGDHYLDQSSILIDGGYITPSYWQLTDYSTATNHQADTGTVDIGFHYPSTNDVDGDGLINTRESQYGTSTTNADSDADGLLDGDEADIYGTDPTAWDTDGDGDGDGDEVTGGSDPLDDSSFLTTISGTISYSGGQTGVIHVTALADPGLVLYFNFDQASGTNAVDQSGLTNNGAMFGGATWTSNGYAGGSLFFDGTNDYIRVPYSSSYNLTQFTVSAWVKLNESALSTTRGIMGRHRAANDMDSWFIIGQTTLSSYLPQIWGYDGTRGEVMVGMDNAENQWGFMTMTFDGTTLKFYTNAIFAGSAVISGYSGNTYDLLIGAGEYTLAGNVPSLFWYGWIDEVKVHDRVLGQVEVSRLYTSGSASTNEHVATISDPGLYTITNVPTRLRYYVDAWRDSDGDGQTDATEAQGIYLGNLLELNSAATNINVTLTDIDTDQDGIPDWWEIQYGFNPSSGVHASQVGWWKFDETSGTNANNSASTGYDGQLVNMSTSVWVSGKLGSALQFDGNNDYVRVPQSPVLITGQQYTASGWVYLESTSNDDYPSLIADFDLCSGVYKGFWLGYDKYVPGIAVLDTDCLGSFVYPNYATTLTGTWTYVATTYDGSTATLYRNGMAVSSSSGAFAPALQSELRIGWANDPWASYYWEGKLDDVRLYTAALSSNAIYTIYDALQDPDGDGLNNLGEYENGTNPNESDTDSDGLNDYDELNTHGTSPVLADTDGDGLDDDEEINTHGTDPIDWDSDDDGIDDGIEIQMGTNPLDSLPSYGLNRNWMFYNNQEFASPSWELVPGLWQRFHMIDYETGTNSLFIILPQNVALDAGGTNKVEVRLWWSNPTQPTNETQQWLNALHLTSTVITVSRQFHGLPTMNHVTVDVYRLDYAQPPFEERVDIWYLPLVKSYTNDVETDYAFLASQLLLEDEAISGYGTNNWPVAPQHYAKNYSGRDYHMFHDPMLLRNASFDDGLEGGLDNVPHWTPYGVGWGFSTTIVHEGSTRSFVATDAGGIYQNIVVYPGEELVISGYMYTPSLTNEFDPNPLTDDRHGEIAIEYFGAGAGPMLIKPISFYSSSAQDQWRFVSVTSIVPNHAKTANISLRAVLPKWEISGPGHVYFDTLTVTRSLDSDRDGIPDWWEVKYELDPYNPNDAIEEWSGDGLINIRKYRLGLDPTTDDTTGDGIPDWWLLSHGLNPLDTSLVYQDLDGDGLTVLQEYQAGADPWNSDTDGDGLADGFEVLDYQSDPLIADFAGFNTILEINGSDATGVLGPWNTNGTSLFAGSRRGYAEYEFTIATSEIYRIEIEANDRNDFVDWRGYELRLTLEDEVFLTRTVLYSENNENGRVGVFTPWLTNGVYTIRVYWDNAYNHHSLQIQKIRLQKVQGPDDNQNDIPDWVENRLSRQSNVDSEQHASHISPANIEGNDPYRALMSISGGGVSQKGAGHRWYEDIPLNPTAAIERVYSFQNGGRVVTNQILWVPYNVLTNGDIFIRQNDSLMLSALPAGATSGTMRIEIVGVAAYTSAVNASVTHMFNTTGAYNVVGEYIPDVGSPTSMALHVHVLDAIFPESPACWIQTPRVWSVPNLSTNIGIQYDPLMLMGEFQDQSADVRVFQNILFQPENHYIVARAGFGGPIITNIAARGFRLGYGSQTHMTTLGVCQTGDQLIETHVVVSPLLDDLSFKGEIIVGGVLYDDGSVSKEWGPAEFDELGEKRLRFIRSAYAKTATCNILDVFQGTNVIGRFSSGL